MNHIHEAIDAHAERAKQELHDITRGALDRLSVKVGWMIRSMGAKQGWRNRKTKGAEK